ncbi:hypothetical protein [Paraburkholderia fungorum]|uniref:hypothetical protein n=1 Tax=Paraburkholderia fungorum TaxID=134537 RepID=UPI00217DD922|nr:hypothetical protein [Paraburkholderia fungorum]
MPTLHDPVPALLPARRDEAHCSENCLESVCGSIAKNIVDRRKRKPARLNAAIAP